MTVVGQCRDSRGDAKTVGYCIGTVAIVLGHPGTVLGQSWPRLELPWHRSRQCWNIWDSAGIVWNCLGTGRMVLGQCWHRLGEGWNNAGTVRTVLVPPGSVPGRLEQSVLREGSAGRHRVGGRPSQAGGAGRRELLWHRRHTRAGPRRGSASASVSAAPGGDPGALPARPRPGSASLRPRRRVRAGKG